MLCSVSGSHEVPPDRIMQAFGLDGDAHRIAGGQGGSWLVDAVVLKHHDDPHEAAWAQEIGSLVHEASFRLAPRSGPHTARGWSTVGAPTTTFRGSLPRRPAVHGHRHKASAAGGF